jgi:hypothetical protein
MLYREHSPIPSRIHNPSGFKLSPPSSSNTGKTGKRLVWKFALTGKSPSYSFHPLDPAHTHSKFKSSIMVIQPPHSASVHSKGNGKWPRMRSGLKGFTAKKEVMLAGMKNARRVSLGGWEVR